MEFEEKGSKYYLYDKLRKLAFVYYEYKDFDRVQKILSVMVKNWPERVIARGELVSDMNVSDHKLEIPVSIP